MVRFSMQREFDAVVIGAGAAGLASGIVLAEKGFKTLVLEKNASIGGYCATLSDNGYSYDIGATQFRKKWYKFMERFHLKVPWSASFSPFMVWRYDDFDIETPLIVPRILRKFMRLCVPRRELNAVEKLFIEARKVAKDARLRKSLLGISMKDYLSDKISDERIVLALSTLNFCILPPSLVSAGICLFVINDLLTRELGVYPIGGAKTVMHSYLQTYHALGGEIEFNKRVGRILVEENRVKGIETTSGDRIECRVVVSATGIKETVTKLLPRNAVEQRYVDSVKTIKPLPPPFTVVLGLDYLPSKFVHVIRYSPTFEDDYCRYLRGEMPKDPGYLWALPTLVDKSAAPPHRHLMVVFGLTQPFKLRKGNWNSVKDSYADQLVETVSRTSCPDIAEHIVFKKILTPEFYENWSGKTGGPQGGFAMSYDQVEKKPSPHTGIDGLYCISESMGYGGVFLASELAVKTLTNIS